MLNALGSSLDLRLGPKFRSIQARFKGSQDNYIGLSSTARIQSSVSLLFFEMFLLLDYDLSNQLAKVYTLVGDTLVAALQHGRERLVD